MNEYLLYICIVLLCIGIVFQTKYYIHMFQLNGYVAKNQLRYLSENKSKLTLGIVSLAVAVLYEVAYLTRGKEILVVLQILALLALAIYFFTLCRKPAKKKLVYTSRVKRLIVTQTVIIVVCLSILICIVRDNMITMLTIGIIAWGLPYLMILSNVINSPIESAVKNHYINDAKHMLSQASKMRIIGVTGSYGKTSVKYYLDALLSVKYNVLITPESYNTPMGVVKTIRESLKPNHEIFVCEMGARHVGDVKEICDIVHPTDGIITSVGPQHLDTFFNMDNIVKTKFELADAVGEDGKLLLNGDNQYIMSKSKEYSGIIYSTGTNQIGYHADQIEVSQSGTSFRVTSPDGEQETYQMRLIGAHNVINVLGAIAMASQMGISLAELKIPVRRLQPVAHRLQLIEKGNISIIDDAYNSNPVGSKAALDTLALFDGIRILVTPGMVELGDKEEEYNEELGRHATECCDYIVLVGQKRAEPMLRGIEKTSFDKDKVYVAQSLEDAMNYVYAIRTDRRRFVLLENDLPDNY